MGTVTTELLKLLGAFALGLLGKILYDRWLAKRPDLRYKFQAPATFGSGDRERVYQNMIVENSGSESTTDARITFDRRVFEALEHQISFDGTHRIETLEDRSVIVIPTLPPGDSATLSFVFSPRTLATLGKPVTSIEDFFLSARADEVLGRPQGKGDPSNVIAMVLTVALAVVGGITITQPLFSMLGGPKPNIVARDSERPDSEPVIVRVTMQAPDMASAGTEVSVDFFIENVSPDPFTGSVRGTPPLWGSAESPNPFMGEFRESLSIPAGKRISVKWLLKVPKSALPGRYELDGEVSGTAFKSYRRVRAAATLELR